MLRILRFQTIGFREISQNTRVDVYYMYTWFKQYFPLHFNSIIFGLLNVSFAMSSWKILSVIMTKLILTGTDEIQVFSYSFTYFYKKYMLCCKSDLDTSTCLRWSKQCVPCTLRNRPIMSCSTLCRWCHHTIVSKNSSKAYLVSLDKPTLCRSAKQNSFPTTLWTSR